MNKTLAEFLVAKKRPKKTKNYPELNGFLYALACSPEPVEFESWIALVFDDKNAKYKNDQEKEEIEKALLEEFSTIQKNIKTQAPVLPAYFRPADDLMENFDEDSPIAHWGRGFLFGHDWLKNLWDGYFPQDQKSILLACTNVITFFANKKDAIAICEAQNIQGLALAVYAETVIESFDAAAQAYASYGLGIRVAIDEYKASQNTET